MVTFAGEAAGRGRHDSERECNGARPEKKAPKTNKGSLEHIKIHITAFTASSGVKRAVVSHRQAGLLAAPWPNGSSCGRLPTDCNLAATRSGAHRGM